MASQTPSCRKQWSLSRGPKGNVESLVWAECGCPEQQVNLAKQLLEDNGEEGVDKEERARLGVYWLTKASEKGHEEATRMLQDCIENGIGITEHNLSDVKVCLDMSQGEKLSREAAKELFVSLSQGENFITAYQLHKEISKRSIENSNIEGGNIPNWDILAEGSGEKVTEEMLVVAASNHSRGQLPSVLKQHSMLRSSRVSSLVTRISEASILSHFLIILTLFLILGLDIFTSAVPLLIYYGSLIFMVISSCQVITKKWDFANFQRWSNLLVSYGCDEQISLEAQWSHCLQNNQPCFIFLLSLITNLLLVSYVPDPPMSEIAVLSTFMSLFCLYNLTHYKKKVDILTIVTFVVHLLARYPYDRDTLVSQYWRNLDVHVPTFTSYVLGSSVEFCLNFHVLFYLMLPGLFLGIAIRDRWLGICKTLLPLLVCLSWWQLAVIASKGATYFGLIRACLGVVCIIIFVPMMSLTLLFIPLAMFSKLFITETISTPVAIGGIILSSVLYLGSRGKRWGKFFYYLMVLLSVASVFLSVNYETEKIQNRGLQLKEFENICTGKDIQSIETCLSLSGSFLTWEAKILSSKIASVHNVVSPFVHRLPEDLQDTVKCLIGEKFQDCNEENCKIAHTLSSRCHLSNWNRYEFIFEVELSSNSWVEESTIGLLMGGNDFRNHSQLLKQGDSVWFSGYLTSNIKNPRQPHVHLKSLNCLSCSQGSISFSEIENNFTSVLLKPFVDFLFYPVVVFK
ncbi:wolframin isoform X2 [Halyomorpha halys]|uniref:wolframin isoform X2 n=1 Tax=Halyomorpha halys TaxID=286706 RepID=UPI0006D505D8|nr:wolframin-like isoform X2 [Halyomorpha halys]